MQVVITTLNLSEDYSHVIVRDGDQYDSPILLQQHHDLHDNQTLSKLMIDVGVEIKLALMV